MLGTEQDLQKITQRQLHAAVKSLMRTEERIGNYLHVSNLLSSPGKFYEQYTRAISCTTYAVGGGDLNPSSSSSSS